METGRTAHTVRAVAADLVIGGLGYFVLASDLSSPLKAGLLMIALIALAAVNATPRA